MKMYLIQQKIRVLNIELDANSINEICGSPDTGASKGLASLPPFLLDGSFGAIHYIKSKVWLVTRLSKKK
jgi:hypothetical protein